MNPSHEADSIKVKNVVDMAVTFTAMIRVFEEGSKQKIVERLEHSFRKLVGVSSKIEFETVHSEFCEWFVKNIATASKTLKNKKEKKSQPASYGHAAKVFDIAVKVYVHYCHLPNCESAVALLPLLHGAVDTPIMKNLKSRYQTSGIKAETIESVGKPEYTVLQSLVEKHIQEEFKSGIFPAQYDDIMWHRLNRRGYIQQTKENHMADVVDGEEREGDVAVTTMYCPCCGKTTTWQGTYVRKWLVGRETARDGWKCRECGNRK